MIPAYVITIQTPKKILLNGLWFGPKNPKRVIIWVHGLASSAFSKLSIVEQLVDDETAVMTFNNRGHDTVTRISKINTRSKDGFDRFLGGGAHEKFTDCVDDIQGAIDFARLQSAEDIYLAGHSTGCQKSVYFATRKGNEGKVKGVVLLAPISDYAAAVQMYKGTQTLKKLVAAAKKFVSRSPHSLVPDIVPGSWVDAQRFLSLYTPDSAEEIFTYIDPNRTPKTYRALVAPTLVLLAESDEYSDRPASEMAEWFDTHTRAQRYESKVIPKADHGFKGAESGVANAIKEWILA